MYHGNRIAAFAGYGGWLDNEADEATFATQRCSFESQADATALEMLSAIKGFASPPTQTVSRREFDALSARISALEALLRGRGIEKNPGVCGGAACIVRTRIPVWTLEAFRRQGATEAQMLASYPTLNAADLVSAWAYVALNEAEIDAEIRENDEAE